MVVGEIKSQGFDLVITWEEISPDVFSRTHLIPRRFKGRKDTECHHINFNDNRKSSTFTFFE